MTTKDSGQNSPPEYTLSILSKIYSRHQQKPSTDSYKYDSQYSSLDFDMENHVVNPDSEQTSVVYSMRESRASIDLKGDDKENIDTRHQHLPSMIVKSVAQTYNDLLSGFDRESSESLTKKETGIQKRYWDKDIHFQPEVDECQEFDMLSDLTFSDDSKRSTVLHKTSGSVSFASNPSTSTIKPTTVKPSSKLTPPTIGSPSDLNHTERHSTIFTTLSSDSSRILFPEKNTPGENSKYVNTSTTFRIEKSVSALPIRVSTQSMRMYCSKCDAEVRSLVSVQLKSMNL
jgi:hypothetical protein